MNEAYLIMSNMNNSNTSIFLGNAIICEGCDLEEMAVVSLNSNVTLIIKTEYAYDFEVRSLPSNALLQCYLTSYKFSEHGTYLFEVRQSAEEDNEICSVVQIGESSRYWSPIIVGLVVWIVFIAIIQLCYHIYHRGYFHKYIATIFKQRLTRDNTGQAEYNARHSEADKSLPPVKSSHLSNKTIDPNSIKSKRFQALDALRGFTLMVVCLFFSFFCC